MTLLSAGPRRGKTGARFTLRLPPASVLIPLSTPENKQQSAISYSAAPPVHATQESTRSIYIHHCNNKKTMISRANLYYLVLIINIKGVR